MNTSVKRTHKLINLFWQTHEKVSSWTAHLIGPMVFNCGIKEPAWNMRKVDFLRFPKETVGRALGDFFEKNRLEPIAGAESHDLYHVLFNFSSTFIDEVALQFFLRGNGKNSLASFGTAVGGWIILPFHWSYLKTSYARGKRCSDISKIDLKAILFQDLNEVKNSLIKNENHE